MSLRGNTLVNIFVPVTDSVRDTTLWCRHWTLGLAEWAERFQTCHLALAEHYQISGERLCEAVYHTAVANHTS